ncbi:MULTISPECIES: HD-GYP domain-containing protein [Vibrio]|jgi:HD-GYP domain-containing protein (c-di-GMP phosphodiesterase class II)|uniref:HD family phosphohydrolase n=1 Tax=Vibrio rotiferianus TaxID=190895 RepID=A0ABX3DDB8_9VIBR|nr:MULTISPECIES: HD-GYP domain-containing protein [Vibrio]ASI96628.1 HD family phosphohydrolase [Vibrio rotiferianus]MDK9777935.1 HD-GYP domain-containing protein [Vibrio sp. D401a]MDK9805785.1 HD-GYP domain-containing protein [Vibrio sp. D406a]NOH65698.1 HD-GYP domain-containing protein [Vibrio rotiferianus]OHY95700.1 HD family phosphohydrolase [Vibrio rotiferianus]
MQYNPEDSIKIAIADMGVGMFVTAIEQNKRVNLANAGRVSTQQGIEKLKASGVKFVWVDQKLSSSACVFKPVAAESEELSPVEEQTKVPRAFRTREAQHKRAKKLIAEAKGLAQKLLNQTFEGKVIEVDEIESWADDMIESVFIDSDALQCVSALRQKDTYLLEHSVNVACLLVTFGKHLGLNKETLKQLAIGGIIHDVGKIKVDDAVLHKPARLTPEEFEHMKLHQVFAGEIILGVKGLSDVSRDVCLMHHEKLDGNGYPRGLSGDQIPMHGRMSCIVDIYDALTADRVYKKGMSSAEAFKILLSLTPSHLDPDLVYKFINCIGVYPVGSIVQLSDGRVGIVWTSNESQPLKPIVKCFYSRKYKRYIDVAMVDLKNSPHSVEKAVAPSSLEVDPKPFYD